jgi:hypothetical protein
MRLFEKKLTELGIDYIMAVRGGRLNPHQFQIVTVKDPSRIVLYGQSARVSGSEFFNMQAKYQADMERLFGKGTLPVTGIPALITKGLFATATENLHVKQERRDACDYAFEAAPIDHPLVKLIYTLCLILNAHPCILLAGSDVRSKKWDLPVEGRKHRVDKARWAVAFTFSGFYYSNLIDKNRINMDAIKKGFLGTPQFIHSLISRVSTRWDKHLSQAQACYLCKPFSPKYSPQVGHVEMD